MCSFWKRKLNKLPAVRGRNPGRKQPSNISKNTAQLWTWFHPWHPGRLLLLKSTCLPRCLWLLSGETGHTLQREWPMFPTGPQLPSGLLSPTPLAPRSLAVLQHISHTSSQPEPARASSHPSGAAHGSSPEGCIHGFCLPPCEPPCYFLSLFPVYTPWVTLRKTRTGLSIWTSATEVCWPHRSRGHLHLASQMDHQLRPYLEHLRELG